MKYLLTKILETIKTIETRKKNIIESFDKYTPQECIDAKTRLTTEIAILNALQNVALNTANCAEIAGIVASGELFEGIHTSEWHKLKITAEQAFGKPYCSAEEWYKNTKLQALYPNKYSK